MGGTRELRKIFFELISVKVINDEINELFKEKIIKIQAVKNNGGNTTSLEKEIDQMLFNLYDLTFEERETIGFIEIT